ncbi:MAG TPA: hypothetical protein VNN18_11850 [Candidatus Xenobia bacterium]|nr:hypothetical protein [Candidatus Xenobia bacterium]
MSGGHVGILAREETDDSLALVRPGLSGRLVQLLSASGMSNGEIYEYSVPVDDTVESITFSVLCDVESFCFQPTISSPSGVVTGPFTALRGGYVLSVDSPQSGTWHLQASGFGEFWVQALAKSDLRLNRFDFVTLTGRPGHEGLFPLEDPFQTPPPYTALASLLGPFQTAEFKFLSLDGRDASDYPTGAGRSQCR